MFFRCANLTANEDLSCVFSSTMNGRDVIMEG